MRKGIIVAVGLAMFLAVGAAWGASTPVTVSAQVVATCQFSQSGSIDFGALDTVGAPALNAPTIVKPVFQCTSGTPYNISDTAGAGTVLTNAGGDTIPYTFNLGASTSGVGAGLASNISIDISASIAAGAYLNANAGTYSHAFTVSVNP
jgi:spore coat protein U-like protein